MLYQGPSTHLQTLLLLLLLWLLQAWQTRLRLRPRLACKLAGGG